VLWFSSAVGVDSKEHTLLHAMRHTLDYSIRPTQQTNCSTHGVAPGIQQPNMTVARIRGRALQRMRELHLRSQPLCVSCLTKTPKRITAATELDHVVALCNGGTHDASNLQGLCRECHADKTAQDMGYTRRPTIGADGWPIGAA